MVVTQVLCDVCGRPLYTKVVDGSEVTYWDHGTKLEQFPHLCKSCTSTGVKKLTYSVVIDTHENLVGSAVDPGILMV